jgi:hypothetical protein
MRDDTEALEVAIKECQDPQIRAWLQELRTHRGGPWCPGCGSPVVAKGGLCHSCRDGSHHEEDRPWLTRYAGKQNQEL